MAQRGDCGLNLDQQGRSGLSSIIALSTAAGGTVSSVRSCARRKNCFRMPKDYIVDEVRRVREEQAAKYAFDVKAILGAARKRQRRSGRKVVTLAQKNKLTA